MLRSVFVFFILLTGFQVQGQDHIPVLISNGGDVQSNGNLTVHIAIGEPVVVFNDGAEYVGLGFLQGITRSEPCAEEDMECICARDPENPACIEVTLDNYNFLIDPLNPVIPPRTLQIEGSFHLTVYNRWGKQEFSTLGNEKIRSWDGVDQRGLDLDNGVYFYVLESPGCKDGKCKGSVTLLR